MAPFILIVACWYGFVATAASVAKAPLSSSIESSGHVHRLGLEVLKSPSSSSHESKASRRSLMRQEAKKQEPEGGGSGGGDEDDEIPPTESPPASPAAPAEEPASGAAAANASDTPASQDDPASSEDKPGADDSKPEGQDAGADSGDSSMLHKKVLTKPKAQEPDLSGSDEKDDGKDDDAKDDDEDSDSKAEPNASLLVQATQKADTKAKGKKAPGVDYASRPVKRHLAAVEAEEKQTLAAAGLLEKSAANASAAIVGECYMAGSQGAFCANGETVLQQGESCELKCAGSFQKPSSARSFCSCVGPVGLCMLDPAPTQLYCRTDPKKVVVTTGFFLTMCTFAYFCVWYLCASQRSRKKFNKWFANNVCSCCGYCGDDDDARAPLASNAQQAPPSQQGFPQQAPQQQQFVQQQAGYMPGQQQFQQGYMGAAPSGPQPGYMAGGPGPVPQMQGGFQPQAKWGGIQPQAPPQMPVQQQQPAMQVPWQPAAPPAPATGKSEPGFRVSERS